MANFTRFLSQRLITLYYYHYYCHHYFNQYMQIYMYVHTRPGFDGVKIKLLLLLFSLIDLYSFPYRRV